MKQKKKYTIESELTKALMQFSFGKLTIAEVKKKLRLLPQIGIRQMKHWHKKG